jgi:thiamine biosynthesis protein ThiI
MGLVLVRYGEIALKGRNRPAFLRRLRRNIRASLAASGLASEVVTAGRRAYVRTADPRAALEPLSRVFGVVSASPVTSVPPALSTIIAEVLLQAADACLGPERTFRVMVRRVDKSFPLLSPDVARQAGAAVVERYGATADLSKEAEVTIGIEITRDSALVFSNTTRGPGGVPVAIEGRVVALLSGGIDSYIAAWMMMRRGCAVIPLHFSIADAQTDFMLEQVAQLQRYSHGWYLRPAIMDYRETIAPLLQRLCGLRAQRWTCLVCKHAMLAQAVALAQERGAHAIVVGDSLGQVASQTLRNIEAISYGISLPVYRPLIGMDKGEITALAERIGAPSPGAHMAVSCPYLPENPVTRAPLQSFVSLMERLALVEEKT